MNESSQIDICESYKDYIPPIPVRKTIRQLLRGIPPKYLIGLGRVVVTNTESLPRRERRKKTISRKKRVNVAHCSGYYQQAWDGQPAWIQLIIDNILEGFPRWMLRIPLLRVQVVGKTLFHELGHHIHQTQSPEYKEREDVADNWGRKLLGHYLCRRYWYLLPILIPMAFTLKPPLRFLQKRISKQQQPSKE